MALKNYDARRDQLVMETQTLWDPDIEQELSDEDKALLSTAIHRAPELAEKVEYERSHTGFVRTITVTVNDLERLYQQRA